jgi:hypothetical protein
MGSISSDRVGSVCGDRMGSISSDGVGSVCGDLMGRFYGDRIGSCLRRPREALDMLHRNEEHALKSLHVD